MIKIKRVYEKKDITDGFRILVDRLWPRGVNKSTSGIDLWLKDVGPSNALRKWFAHDPSKWMEFKKKYQEELRTNKAFDELLQQIQNRDTITLLYSAKDTEHNNAMVIIEVLNERTKKM